MKKLIAIITVVALTVVSAGAQPGHGYSYGRDLRPGSGMHRNHYGSDWYGGIKFGLVASHVSSESSELEGNRIKSGKSLGLAAGFNISPMTAFESGLYYVEKGGSSKNADGRFTYGLNYLEVPLVLKWYVPSDGRAVFQPFAGGYLGLGVGGKIKDYSARETFSSYESGYFRRGDSGLTFGCGVSYYFLYASVGYELGLSNIGRDDFSQTKNRAIVFSVGFAF